MSGNSKRKLKNDNPSSEGKMDDAASPNSNSQETDSSLLTKKQKLTDNKGTGEPMVVVDDSDEEEDDNDSELEQELPSDVEEEEDDDDILMEEMSPTLSSTNNLNAETVSCKVLTTEQIIQLMNDYINESNVVLQLPTTTLRALLSHFKWNQEKLYAAYFDGDQEKLYTDAHIALPIDAPGAVSAETGNEAGKSDLVCEICGDDKEPAEMFDMECRHSFCRTCWKQYLTTQIVGEGLGGTITCAAFKCLVLVDDAIITELVNDPNVMVKYEQLMINTFVNTHQLMRWCPSPSGCSNAVLVNNPDLGMVTCTCSHSFCFQCGSNVHDPIKCEWLKKWLKKCSDDSETANWISAHTKDCPNPKCNSAIEKNGGCNHMSCRQCGYEFCWFCMGNWRNHIACNRFRADSTEANTSRAALKRYLFYFTRYDNHLQSLQFENRLYTSVREKMDEMQRDHGMTWSDVQFLITAVNVLCHCRQTLMYTYAFAFYLQQNNQSIIFEDNQTDLEKATETLSGYLEREITTESLTDIQQRVQDKYRYCEQRRNVLISHVNEGYNDDLWLYNE